VCVSVCERERWLYINKRVQLGDAVIKNGERWVLRKCIYVCVYVCV
jgi:hypothetical protein